MAFEIYLIDTETTGIEVGVAEIIEISLYRLSNNDQKTWCIKPMKYENISQDALRVNGHKLEDLMHKTAHGKETYKNPEQVISEIENWMMEDFSTPDDRIFVAQNAYFDKLHMEHLWKSHGFEATFPFGRKYLDTIQIELFLDYVDGKQNDFYNLSSLVERYKVKKEKSHKADSDTRMMRDVFLSQIKRARK